MDLISLINAFPFGRPAEKGYFLYSKVPPQAMQALEASNFRKTIAYVYERSKFYRRRFDELGIRPSAVKSPADLGDFFTTAEDIREHTEDFICARPDTAFETTGTTSKRPKRIFFSRDEVREAGWAGAVGLWGVGVRPEDRVASAFDYSLWVSGPVLKASCEVLGCFHVEAARIAPAEFYDRMKDYGLTVIVGDPTWILVLSEIAEKKGAWPLKLLIGGGENFTEEARRYVEKVWKADCLLSYGQTEAFGTIGMESLDKDGYQLNGFHNHFEIVHPDPDGYGELVYTTLNRRVMPLVRYRSGDITRFIQAPSKSGLPGRRIEKLKGRMTEWTATAVGNLAPWIFEPMLQGLDGIGADWQIVVDKENEKDLIQICVESDEAAPGPRDRVLSRLHEQWTDAWKFQEMGFCRIDVKVLPKGTLRTGRKVARLVDKREF